MLHFVSVTHTQFFPVLLKVLGVEKGTGFVAHGGVERELGTAM